IPLYVHTPPKPEGVLDINSEKYILYLGRNDGNKRVELLLEAFLQLTDTDYSLYVTLNPDDITSALFKKVRDDRRIKWLGYVDEEQKEKLLQRADAVVFPTSWESFGYVAFEASQYAKPLLCSDLPVFRELLDSNGVIFFHNTIDSLTAALREFLLLSEEKKRAMGMANYRRLSNFTFEKAKQQYQALFERLQTT
ncbi:MAG: glycosyltransferase, partial [Bacteroidota bacterium]